MQQPSLSHLKYLHLSLSTKLRGAAYVIARDNILLKVILIVCCHKCSSGQGFSGLQARGVGTQEDVILDVANTVDLAFSIHTPVEAIAAEVNVT